MPTIQSRVVKNSFFVVQIGGTQHIVSEGDTIKVNRLEGKVGDKIVLDEILLIQGDDSIELGSPYAPYTASADIIEQSKSPKLRVFKYKAKARYRKTKGHRQSLTVLKITKLSKKTARKQPAQKSEEPKEKKAVSTRKK